MNTFWTKAILKHLLFSQSISYCLKSFSVKTHLIKPPSSLTNIVTSLPPSIRLDLFLFLSSNKLIENQSEKLLTIYADYPLNKGREKFKQPILDFNRLRMSSKIKRILFFVILAASLQPLGAIPITSAMVDCASAAEKVNRSHINQLAS